MVGHAIKLEGARLPGTATSDDGPTILSIVEQDFVEWFLDRMRSATGRAQLGARDAAWKAAEDRLRLYQPVHRAFNLVLVEVFCDVEGLPRLDPKKILKAGVTVRRASQGGPQAWAKEGGRILGWRPLPVGASGGGSRWDPDPAVRRTAREGLNAAVLRHSAALSDGAAAYDEAFAPLFPAPPEICKALKRTLLYGYLPLTSGERSEDDAPPEAPFTADVVAERLPVFLRDETRLAREVEAGEAVLPLAGITVDPAQAADPSDALATVIAGVSYLAQEPGLFTAPEGNAPHPTDDLRDLLRARRVEVSGRPGTRAFYDVLRDVYDLMVRRANDTGTAPGEPEPPLRLPVEWPSFDAAEARRFVDAIRTAMAARWAELSPGETRFQDLAARYRVQAFVRVDRSECGCPPETVWTGESREIEIVPWYEGGEAPPTIVELPAPDAKLFASLKPNVAFKVPEEIQRFMSGLKLDKLMEGEKPDDRLGWGMICGFSIPIITICAFIVLQIFLALFHILFWWLPFIRICIPFPKPK